MEAHGCRKTRTRLLRPDLTAQRLYREICIGRSRVMQAAASPLDSRRRLPIALALRATTTRCRFPPTAVPAVDCSLVRTTLGLKLWAPQMVISLTRAA